MKRSMTLAAALLLGQTAIAEMNSKIAPRHVLSLNDVEITALIDDVSIITGFTFVLHPDVRRTKVTVMSQASMSTEEVFDVFLSTLRVHGFAAIPAGKGVYRIVPEQAAIGEANGRAVGPNAFITEIVRLENFDASEAAQMVKPLMDGQGQVVANQKSNTLVLVDYASNMPRLKSLVADLDGSDRLQMQTVALRNVPAREMEGILADLLGGDGGSAATNFEVSASQTSNAIVIRGDELTVARAVRVANELDSTDPVRDTLRVIPLKNADAESLVPILSELAESMASAATPGEGQQSSSTIQHHQPSNSLVVSAPPETLLAIDRVVDALDKRRAQVLVEAIIVDISDDTARELGVEFLLSGTGDSSIPFLSTNFSRSAPNLLALGGALLDPDLFGGTNPFTDAAVSSLLELEGGSVGGAGESGDTLFGVILTAVEQDTNSRVLSKPFNMTLDNGTSSLVVGQEIPITTGETLSSDNTNPFRTVQREQVGVKLDVTPRISADDTVRLDIYQEVSSVSSVLVDTSTDFITNTREITTSILADDGEIIVIGGLIEQSNSQASSKVPILGDIPLLGALFRSEGSDTVRTNLMVFIRPTIIRDRDEARDVTARSYRYIRAEEMLRTGDENSAIDGFISEVLGDLPPIQ